jgi:hypothetical protein
MKAFIFIITLFLSNFVFSQTIKVTVYNFVEYSVYDTLGVLSAISNCEEPEKIVQSKCDYIFDLTNKREQFYKDGVLDEDDVEITYTNDGYLYIIKFMYENLDIGIVLNMDPKNESFTWFSKNGDYYYIAKTTKFEIIKTF